MRFGVITALPIEHSAVRAVLDTYDEQDSVLNDPNEYGLGTILGRSGTTHEILLTLLKGTGNNSAAAAAANLLRSYPTIQQVFVVGIAAGVPCPQKPSDHVRLGDVVVTDDRGVVQFDIGTLTPGVFIPKPPPRPPSPWILGKARVLSSGSHLGIRPWDDHLDRILRSLAASKRPAENTDILNVYDDQGILLRRARHPRQPDRIRGRPKIHFGCIGSSNSVLRDAIKRDYLRQTFGIKAIEMESSGTSESTWQMHTDYFTVRGIADYADLAKGDLWHAYASAAAAAYLRAIIESIASLPELVQPAQPKLQTTSRLFLHYLDHYFLETKGLAKMRARQANTLRQEAMRATWLGAACADVLLISAASYFESPLCRKAVGLLKDRFPLGVVRMVGSGYSVYDYSEGKLQEYLPGSKQFQSYSLGLEGDHPAFLPRATSASAYILSKWESVTDESGASWDRFRSLFDGVSLNTALRSWMAVPDRLEGRAFISEYVGPLLEAPRSNGRLISTLHSVLNDLYFESFVVEFSAGLISDLVYLDERDIVLGRAHLPYRAANLLLADRNLYEEFYRSDLDGAKQIAKDVGLGAIFV